MHSCHCCGSCFPPWKCIILLLFFDETKEKNQSVKNLETCASLKLLPYLQIIHGTNDRNELNMSKISYEKRARVCSSVSCSGTRVSCLSKTIRSCFTSGINCSQVLQKFPESECWCPCCVLSLFDHGKGKSNTPRVNWIPRCGRIELDTYLSPCQRLSPDPHFSYIHFYYLPWQPLTVTVSYLPGQFPLRGRSFIL